MKLGEGLVQILSEDEKLGKGKPFLFPQPVDRYSDERYSENLRIGKAVLRTGASTLQDV